MPGWWVRDLTDVGWDLAVGLSVASGRQLWGFLGAVLGLLLASLEPLGSLLGASWGPLGAIVGLLETTGGDLWLVLGPPGAILTQTNRKTKIADKSRTANVS